MIQIHFHESEFKKALTKLNEFGGLLNEAKNLIQDLTEGDVKQLSLSLTENWVQQKTGFNNIGAAFNLLGKEAQYKRLVEISSRTKLSEENHILKKGSYELKPEAYKKTEETYKVYLDSSLEENYNILSEAVALINKCGVNALKCIIPTTDINKPYTINPYLLNFIQ